MCQSPLEIGAYYYELRAYIYQARDLLSMDHDSFSGMCHFVVCRENESVLMKILMHKWLLLIKVNRLK